MTDYPAVVIVPVMEYGIAKKRAEELLQLRTDLFDMQGDAGQRCAERFMSVFNPNRADEWGHVSWCLNYALKERLGLHEAQ